MKLYPIVYFLIMGIALFFLKGISVKSTTYVKEHKLRYDCGASERDVRFEKQQYNMLMDPATGKIPGNIRLQELAFYNTAIAPFQKNTRAQVWNNAGPYNVGGRTRTVALDKTNENIIVAAGVSGGIWRSTNAGQSWTRVSNELGYLGIIGLTQDARPGFENIWYAVSGELSGNSASGGSAYYLGDGYFKSTDSAKSWQPVTSTSGGTPNSFSSAYQLSWSIASHPAMDSARLFVANYGGILKSTDGGTTWNWTLGNAGNQAYYSDVKISSTGIIYASLSSDGLTHGFYRSADSGKNWTNITPATLLAGHERTSIGINPNNENEVYFFTYLLDSLSPCGTLTSNYKGAPEYISLLKYTYLQGNGADTNGVWLSLSNNIPNNANATTGSFDKLNCQGGYDMFVRVQPTTNAIIIGGTNMYISTDAFATPNNWKQIGGYKQGTSLPGFQVWENHHPDCHDVIFYPSDSKKIISASDGGLHFCENVNNATIAWGSLNNGYITTQPYTVTLDPAAGNNWLLAGFQDNGNLISTNYTNAQKNWVLPLNGDGAFNYIAPNNEFVVMSIQLGRVGKFKLDANGNRVDYRRIDPIGPTQDDYNFINPLVVDANDNNLLYMPVGKKIYRQSELKAIALTNTWDSISQGWTAFSDTIKTANINATRAAQISCLALSKALPANMLYVGTDNREIYRIENAHIGNPTMVNITRSNLPGGGYASSIAVDPTDAAKVMLCYSNYNITSLFYSIDSGRIWRYCGGNLDRNANFSGAAPSIRWVDIMIMPNGKPKYFCGTSIGLYSTDSLWATTVYSKDSTKWIQESVNGIGTSVVNHITHRASDNTVAVSTHGNGCYWSSFAFPSAVSNTNMQSGSILNVFPNPANAIANIELSIATKNNYKVTLVDMFGRKMQTIANALFTPEKYNFSFNTNNLANGNYFIVLENEIGMKISKQIIIKK
jgi:photosystem II stability/assembly factor-like uncharacterized protein